MVSVLAPAGDANFLGKPFPIPLARPEDAGVYKSGEHLGNKEESVKLKYSWDITNIIHYEDTPAGHCRVDKKKTKLPPLPGYGSSHMIPVHSKFLVDKKITIVDDMTLPIANAKNIGICEG